MELKINKRMNEQTGRPATVAYRDVAILRPGRFTDSRGREVEFSAADLAGIAQGFDPLSHRPPLTLDHAEAGPAQGQLSALRWDGRYLRADIAGVAPQLAQEIDAGRWPFRSAEVYARGPDGTYSLRALSLLGARPPAVKGLPAMPSMQQHGAQAAQVARQESATTPQSVAASLRNAAAQLNVKANTTRMPISMSAPRSGPNNYVIRREA